MSHPSTEEWMAYLYGEVPRAQANSLRTHLQSCSDCREQFHGWQSARQDLSKWTLHRAQAPLAFKRGIPVLKWALAALVILGLGCVIGRLSAPKVDLIALRAALEPDLKRSLVAEAAEQAAEGLREDWRAVASGQSQTLNTSFRRQLKISVDQWAAQTAAAATSATQQRLADFAETCRANRTEDHQLLLSLFDRAEQVRRAEHVSLRRAVETVAVVADDKFQRTESELGQLANYAQARFVSSPTNPPFNTQNHPTPKEN